MDALTRKSEQGLPASQAAIPPEFLTVAAENPPVLSDCKSQCVIDHLNLFLYAFLLFFMLHANGKLSNKILLFKL